MGKRRLMIKNSIAPVIDNFAQRLIDNIDGWRQQITNARANTETYRISAYRDIYDFAFEIRTQIDNVDVQNAAQNVMDAITNGRIAEGHLTTHPDSHSLTIYWPTRTEYDNSYENLDFAINTSWDEFLVAYFG